MSNEVAPFRPTNLNFIEQRNRDKALARVEASTELSLARVQATAIEHAAKIEAMGSLTERAQMRGAMIRQTEENLAKLVPLSASTVEAIGDAGVTGLVRILFDAAERLR